MEIVVLLSIMGIVPIILVIFVCYWVRQVQYSHSAHQKAEQLNAQLSVLGLRYEEEGEWLHTTTDSWHNYMGYCKLYDMTGPAYYMFRDHQCIAFDWGGKQWVVRFSKGQYGISLGAEVGIYSADIPVKEYEELKGAYYSKAPDDVIVSGEFEVLKGRKKVLAVKGQSAYFNGFKPGLYAETKSLTLKVSLAFAEFTMCKAYVEALKQAGYKKQDINIRGNKVTVRFVTLDKEEHKDTEEANKEKAMQKINHSNCEKYKEVTKDYRFMGEKLMYLKTSNSILYEFMLFALYGKTYHGWVRHTLAVVKANPVIPAMEVMRSPKSDEGRETKKGL